MSTQTPIGALRTRLILEAPERAADGGGGSAVTWTTLGEVWGDVRATSGSESYEADRVAGSVSHTIVIRYRSGVKPEMRLRSATRVFEIRAVFDPDNRRRWLRCLTEERDL